MPIRWWIAGRFVVRTQAALRNIDDQFVAKSAHAIFAGRCILLDQICRFVLDAPVGHRNDNAEFSCESAFSDEFGDHPWSALISSCFCTGNIASLVVTLIDTACGGGLAQYLLGEHDAGVKRNFARCA